MKWGTEDMPASIVKNLAMKKGLEGRMWMSQGLIYDECYDFLQDLYPPIVVNTPSKMSNLLINPEQFAHPLEQFAHQHRAIRSQFSRPGWFQTRDGLRT